MAVPPQWTEGVCGDGAAILRDGVPVSIEDVLQALNYCESLRASFARLPRRVEYRLPSYEQCTARVEADHATALEQFINDNEPAGPADHDWRADLADVLSEVVEEDRQACMPEKIAP